MKIAVPTDDNYTVAQHFGRTKGFKIFEIENNQIISTEHRTNDFTGHAQGQHHEHEHHNHSHRQHNNSHAGIFNALGDCKVVIAGGMGRRLYDDFVARNIEVFVTKEFHIGTAVELYLKNQLDDNPDGCCNH